MPDALLERLPDFGATALLLFFVLKWAAKFAEQWLGKFWLTQEHLSEAMTTLAAKADQAVAMQDETLIVIRTIAAQNDRQSDRLTELKEELAVIRSGLEL